MSFLSRLFNHHKRDVSLASTGYSPFFVSNDGKVITSDVVDASTALTNSDIYAIVSRIASNIASMPLKVDNPNVKKVLDDPSPLINGFSFWQKVVVQLLLTGNAYVLIYRNGANQPNRLVQVPASNVQINLLSKNDGDKVDDVVYTVSLQEENNAKRFSVSSSEMLHFRCLVTGSDAQTNGYCGVSPLVSLAQEVSVQDQSNKLALEALMHAIAPGYVLKTPLTQLSSKNLKAYRETFEKMASGHNAGRAIVMDSSFDIQPLEVNPNIDKLLSNTTFAQSQIAKAFNVPVEYLNGEGDQQSSIEMMKSLYINGLRIYIEPILSELNKKLNGDIRVDFADLSDIDHQQLITNVINAAGGKTPIMPGRLALRILKNSDALGLEDIPDSVIDSDFANSANTSVTSGGSPPDSSTEGDENNEQSD